MLASFWRHRRYPTITFSVLPRVDSTGDSLCLLFQQEKYQSFTLLALVPLLPVQGCLYSMGNFFKDIMWVGDGGGFVGESDGTKMETTVLEQQ